MVKYLKHRDGGVVAVSDEQFAENIEQVAGMKGAGRTGKRTVDPDYVVLTPAEARKANPQLFGTADPVVEAVQEHDGFNHPIKRGATS